MTSESKSEAELWFARPASRWMEAVPLGNGRIGAMVYGGASTERIDLTESTVWSGAPSDSDVSPTALENLPRIRQLLFDGKYAEGGELCQQHLLGRPASFGTHLPMASLQVAFSGETAPQRYRRSLDLDEAIAHMDCTRGNLRFHREIFSSNPADALIAHLTCDQPASITCDVSFANLVLPGEVAIEGSDTLILKGHAFEHLHSNGKQGVTFVTRLQIRAQGGQITAGSGALHVSNAESVTILLAIATTYEGSDPAARCAQTLAALRNKTYAELRSAHIEDHQALFCRMSIDLGTNPAAEQKPTDERRKAVRAGQADPGLSALFFQYGRYLTFASGLAGNLERRARFQHGLDGRFSSRHQHAAELLACRGRQSFGMPDPSVRLHRSNACRRPNHRAKNV
jgi:alpha-L-fucosidase 2